MPDQQGFIQTVLSNRVVVTIFFLIIAHEVIDPPPPAHRYTTSSRATGVKSPSVISQHILKSLTWRAFQKNIRITKPPNTTVERKKECIFYHKHQLPDMYKDKMAHIRPRKKISPHCSLVPPLSDQPSWPASHSRQM